MGGSLTQHTPNIRCRLQHTLGNYVKVGGGTLGWKTEPMVSQNPHPSAGLPSHLHGFASLRSGGSMGVGMLPLWTPVTMQRSSRECRDVLKQKKPSKRPLLVSASSSAISLACAGVPSCTRPNRATLSKGRGRGWNLEHCWARKVRQASRLHHCHSPAPYAAAQASGVLSIDPQHSTHRSYCRFCSAQAVWTTSK